VPVRTDRAAQSVRVVRRCGEAPLREYPASRANRLVEMYIHVHFQFAAATMQMSACSIDQALACLIDAGTRLFRRQAGESRNLSTACE
jgi:hypothetical protein